MLKLNLIIRSDGLVECELKEYLRDHFRAFNLCGNNLRDLTTQEVHISHSPNSHPKQTTGTQKHLALSDLGFGKKWDKIK